MEHYTHEQGLLLANLHLSTPKLEQMQADLEEDKSWRIKNYKSVYHVENELALIWKILDVRKCDDPCDDWSEHTTKL